MKQQYYVSFILVRLAYLCICSMALCAVSGGTLEVCGGGEAG